MSTPHTLSALDRELAELAVERRQGVRRGHPKRPVM